MENIYITESNVGNGEISVEGRTAQGSIVFGFRAMQCAMKTWRDKARDYTPRGFMPVFQANKPAEMRE